MPGFELVYSYPVETSLERPELRRAAEHLVHPACPVPSGTIKAIEVAAGLALPRDAHIRPSKE